MLNADTSLEGNATPSCTGIVELFEISVHFSGVSSVSTCQWGPSKTEQLGELITNLGKIIQSAWRSFVG